MEKELEAKDLLVKNSIEEKKKELEIAKEIENDKLVPSNYIEVKLSSLGKLDLPSIIHVRDYNYDEALMIASMTEESITEGIVEILNRVVFEDIEMGDANIQDVTEVLLSIYGTWYSPVIETFNYFINEDLEEPKKSNKKNISVATIPINNIKTTPLKTEVQIPINFKNKDFSVQLILPRVKNDIMAWKFATKKNLERENEIAASIKAVKKEKYTDEQMTEYEDFATQRGKDFLKALQCQLIYSYNGKVLETFMEQLETLNKIPLSLWTSYNDVVKSKFQFGVEEEVNFKCSITEKEITRKFRFQPIHFLPLLDKKNDSGFEISFG